MAHGGAMPNVIRSSVAIATALAAAIALAMSAAPASATTYHRQVNFLDWPPELAGGSVCINRRTLQLNGTYTWRAYVKHLKHPARPTVNSRTITLRGKYTWYDCLSARRGIDGPHSYFHQSALFNDRTGGRANIRLHYYGRFGRGDYEWGSTLDNVRSRR
jgi:hypothetical protein